MNDRKTNCPPWCQITTHAHAVHHEAVFDRFGDDLGARATVTVTQHGDDGPALSVWAHTRTADTECIDLAPADALTLVHVLSAINPEDIYRFAAALAEAASVLAEVTS
ncbi:MAG: hypothetical protein JWL97_4526 [Gemmatimonadales bacterium]|jgi:hypothetical protein|nr:hypothetical protein [Gemmatimonadales bacterium]